MKKLNKLNTKPARRDFTLSDSPFPSSIKGVISYMLTSGTPAIIVGKGVLCGGISCNKNNLKVKLKKYNITTKTYTSGTFKFMELVPRVV